MEDKGDFTKILAWVGTILAWSPILAVILGTILIFAPGTAPSGMVSFFDYVWPAVEPAALFGAAVLLWAAFRARSRRRLIGWSLLAALVLGIGGTVLLGLGADFTFDSSEGLLVSILLMGLGPIGLAGYAFAYILIGVGGILLLRDLYRREPTAQAA